MFDDWRERRQLNHTLRQLNREYLPQLKPQDGKIDVNLYIRYQQQRTNCEERLKQITQAKLHRKAVKLGVDLPSGDLYIPSTIAKKNQTTTYGVLTLAEQIKFSKRIRDEQRKNLEFWIKILIPIMTALTGLIGTLIGVIAVLRR